MKAHGRGGYNLGCRCEVCVEANRAYSLEWDRKHGRKPMKPSEHGTTNRYQKYGCRCDLCRAANTAAHAAYIKRKAAREAFADPRP